MPSITAEPGSLENDSWEDVSWPAKAGIAVPNKNMPRSRAAAILHVLFFLEFLFSPKFLICLSELLFS